MIGRLAGRIVEDAGDGTVIVDVGGVGYELFVPLGTLGRLAADPAGVVLWVHTQPREDALLLFGFASRPERAVFRTLISISGIGPKIAVAILGALSVVELAEAVARRQPQRLTAIPGVGKKTAERILLELKDKLLAPPEGTAVPGAPSRRGGSDGGKAELLHGTLTRLGWRPAEADRAVASLAERVESEPLDALVRDALALLSR
ncbi:MAG: Holliday junction branch migration protein RuvA [Polyangiaceae bacterium]